MGLKVSDHSFSKDNQIKTSGVNPGNDELLWKNMKEGSELAFDQLYHTYIKDIFRYASRINDNKELIEDSIQDLFVEIWRSREDLPNVRSIKYYLFKRIKRKIIRKLIENRKLPLSRNILEDYNFEIVFSHESQLIDTQITKDKKAKLLRALNKLTRRQKEAITLRFFDGLSHKEIGGLLSMSPKSARNLIYRAMLVLKNEMAMLLFLLLIG